MPRPPRLKSELDATSPVTAAPPKEPTWPAKSARRSPAHADTAPPSGTVAATRKTNRGRVGPYLDEQQADRLRACYVQGWLQDHRGTFSDMLEQFLIQGAQNIEREKNAGKPWPPITAGAIKSLSQMNIEAGRRAKLS